jgi:hypothetical protein
MKLNDKPVNVIRLATAYKFKAEELREGGYASAANVAESAFKDLCKIAGFDDKRDMSRKAVAGELFEVLDEWNEEEGHGLQPDWLIELAGKLADRVFSPAEQSLDELAAELSDKLLGEGWRISVGHSDSETEQQLWIYCELKKDVRKMPKEYKGVPVTVVHSGRVRPC